MGLRILIVDDNPHLRGALRKFLEKRPDWVIAGEASDGVEAVEKAAELKPDVILMDVTMPRLSGFTAIRLIRGKAPQCEIVILSQHPFALMGDPARKAGARAYVEKSEMATALLSAIEAASRHEPKPMPDPEPLPPEPERWPPKPTPPAPLPTPEPPPMPLPLPPAALYHLAVGDTRSKNED